MFCTRFVFCKESQSPNSLFQQANGDPHNLSRQIVMHHESLYGRLYNIDKTEKIMENVDFCAKLKQEISIHMVNLSPVSKNEDKCRIKEVKLRC